MTKHPQRKSLRLQDYDYSQDGAYFVTICTHQRLHLFGAVVDGDMCINEWGQIVQDEWQKTAILRPYVELDAFVVMPNHVHGILLILHPDDDDNERRSGMMHHASTNASKKREFSRPIPQSLSTIVGAFKASVTRQINRSDHPSDHPIWQRNFHDHIIRNLPDLNRIREYVHTNPARWNTDTLYR